MSRAERANGPTRAPVRRRWLHASVFGLALFAACSDGPSSRTGRRDATADAAPPTDRPASESNDAASRSRDGSSTPGAASRDAASNEDASPPTPNDPDAATGPSSPPDAGSLGHPALEWQRAVVPLAADGRTRPHTLSIAPSARAFAVRTSLPRPDPNVCFQLEEVTHGDDVWVGPASVDDYGDYCLTCRERVAAGSGYGFHVLPSGADDAPTLGTISLRVALRDCATLTPLSAAEVASAEIILEHASWSPPPAASSLTLPLSIVVASEHAFALDATLLPRALELLVATWRNAAIEIEVTTTLAVEAPADPLTYDAIDRSALIALLRSARAALAANGIAPAWPLIILGPCLRREDVLAGGRSEPLATTPHIPGGFGLADEPDAIFVAAERCEGLRPGPRFLDPLTLGAILAHELGHYLGLFHVTEADGRSDNLSDTVPASPNLMQLMPDPRVLTLTDSQIRVARRHLIFARSSRLQQP